MIDLTMDWVMFIHHYTAQNIIKMKSNEDRKSSQHHVSNPFIGRCFLSQGRVGFSRANLLDLLYTCSQYIGQACKQNLVSHKFIMIG